MTEGPDVPFESAPPRQSRHDLVGAFNIVGIDLTEAVVYASQDARMMDEECREVELDMLYSSDMDGYVFSDYVSEDMKDDARLNLASWGMLDLASGGLTAYGKLVRAVAEAMGVYEGRLGVSWCAARGGSPPPTRSRGSPRSSPGAP